MIIGKSAIAKTICSSFENAYLLTVTKQLQDQYKRDFKDLKSIKGKSNYPCSKSRKTSCDMGPCMVDETLLKECRKYGACPYYAARDIATNATQTLTSYQYFFRAIDYPKIWHPRDILILDECHLIESQFIQWAEIRLFPKELNEQYKILRNAEFTEIIRLVTTPEGAGYEANKEYLERLWDLICIRRDQKFEEIKVKYNGKTPEELTEDELDELASTNSDYFDLDILYKKLSRFFKLGPEIKNRDWIIEPVKDGLIITPINISSFFVDCLKNWSTKKVIFMSATILDLPGFCKQLGIPKEKVGIIKMDSTFDPEKSPIIYRPSGQMNYANLDNSLPNIVKEIKIILKKHKNEKGIIHTGNYKIAQYIFNEIDNDRLIMKEEKESNEQLIQRHIISKKPTVLVSPSLMAGTDLKDELSRFQIIIKMPWISLDDKRVKAKMALDDNWYAVEMFRSFIQACGRSTRSDKDWSITYVLDSSFFKWVFKYKKWFPASFLKRIKWK